MGNGGFYGCLSEPQCVSAWWKEATQIPSLINHSANRHCRVHFLYTFVGQTLLKQLYSLFRLSDRQIVELQLLATSIQYGNFKLGVLLSRHC